MKLFTLIHICENEQSIHNSWVKDFRDQISLYLRCAIKLQATLKPEGIELEVLTNDKKYLRGLGIDLILPVHELNFKLNVPSKVKFYSAHYKIEVYRYLSSLKEPYTGIVDSDLICINRFPESLNNCIAAGVPLYYNITGQVVPAFGGKRIIADKELLGNYTSSGLWAGGEFMTGSPDFFAGLYAEVSQLTDRYFANFRSFHHQGDEMLVSVAIEKMLLKGDVIMDAGSLGIIHRYWNGETLHEQISLKGLSGYFLLHLPGDKKFIAELEEHWIEDRIVFKNYLRYVKLSRIYNSLRRLIKI